MDLATELGEQGFKNIFIIHGHGAPNHQRALDQASDFFNDTYQGNGKSYGTKYNYHEVV